MLSLKSLAYGIIKRIESRGVKSPKRKDTWSKRAIWETILRNMSSGMELYTA